MPPQVQCQWIILKTSAEKNNTQGRVLEGQVLHLLFMSLGQIGSIGNGVPQQNLTVIKRPFTEFCFEAMLLTQKCWWRIGHAKFNDFHNKTLCTRYGDSWENFFSDVGAKNGYNHPEQLVSLCSCKVFPLPTGWWEAYSHSYGPCTLHLGHSDMQFNCIPGSILFPPFLPCFFISFYSVKYYVFVSAP